MRTIVHVGLILLTSLLYPLTLPVAAFALNEQPSILDWPKIDNTTKPWTYWWWMGSAVDEANITRELELYRDAGLGGVHIIPIYGAKGLEDQYIEYLSPRWMEMLEHTVKEAQRLGLGVDMTGGTGWNFGGPTITPDLACLSLDVKQIQYTDLSSTVSTVDRTSLVALVAYGPNGESINLTDQLNSENAKVEVPTGEDWKIYLVKQKNNNLQVERAAPGGEGLMLNPFYDKAMQHYLERFTHAFSTYKGPLLRAMYNDSYEYNCAWSPNFLEEFQKRRGYRLETQLPALFHPNPDEAAMRVKADFRETLSDLLLDHYTKAWVNWAHRQGFITRNQAHGSPGNLLDLYAAADIPETEMFNKDRDVLMSKLASSAAHVTGKKLVSAETGTWLAEHFTVTLADLKHLVDELFWAGVNHIIYHGTCYSPAEADWPGWLFYASTQMNPRNSIWNDVRALNQYITLCQGILQNNRTDNDLLLYWPIHEYWYDQKPLVEGFSVHRPWLYAKPVGPLARQLQQRGYCFDYISDRMLQETAVQDREIETSGKSRYRAIVVPSTKMISLETFEKLLYLAQEGASVIFQSNLPTDVPGSNNLQERRQRLQAKINEIPLQQNNTPEIRIASFGTGQILVGNVETALQQLKIRREALVDQDGLHFLRLKGKEVVTYFIVNRSERYIEQWLPLSASGDWVVLSEKIRLIGGLAAFRKMENNTSEVFVQMHPGQSIFISLYEGPRAIQENFEYEFLRGDPQALTGQWNVDFVSGGPDLPPSFRTERLTSWTEQGGEAVQRFAGTGRYTLLFDAPEDTMRLNLGKVCQSAEVRVNGVNYGTLITEPFTVLLRNLKRQNNLLEVDVTNVSANRIRDLDRRKVDWKRFYDINFVNIAYKPFDASEWPLHDSGLLGPVTLQSVDLKSRLDLEITRNPQHGLKP